MRLVVCHFCWCLSFLCVTLFPVGLNHGQESSPETTFRRPTLVRTSEHFKQLSNRNHRHQVEALVLTRGIRNVDMLQINQLPNVTQLALIDTYVTDVGLRHLQGMRGLTRLKIHDGTWGRFKGWALSYLDKLESLKILEIEHPNKEGRKQLVLDYLSSSFPNLESLRIGGGRKLNVRQLTAIGKCVNLKHLDLAGEYDERDLLLLSTLTNLESMKIRFKNVDDWTALRNFHKLESLDMRTDKVSSSFFDSIPTLSHLRDLRLWSTPSILADELLLKEQIAGGLRSNSMTKLTITSRGQYLCNEEMHLPNLRDLEISGIFSREHLNHISRLESLESISIRAESMFFAEPAEPWFDNGGFEPLRDLKHLKRLGALGPISEQMLEDISQIGSLEELYVSGDRFGTNALSPLANLVNLERLSVSGLVHDVELPHLPRLHRLLIYFDVEYGGKFSAQGLAPESQPNLKSLEFKKCSVDLTAIRRIGDMVDLEELIFSDVFISTDRVSRFEDIQRLSKLKSVSLMFSNATDSDVSYFAKLEFLEAINLFRTDVTSAGILAFDGHPNLKFLVIGGNQVVFESMPFLPALRIFESQSCELSNEAIRAIAKSPNLEAFEITNSIVDWDVLADCIPQMANLSTIFVADQRERGIDDELARLNMLNLSLYIGHFPDL